MEKRKNRTDFLSPLDSRVVFLRLALSSSVVEQHPHKRQFKIIPAKTRRRSPGNAKVMTFSTMTTEFCQSKMLENGQIPVDPMLLHTKRRSMGRTTHNMRMAAMSKTSLFLRKRIGIVMYTTVS